VNRIVRGEAGSALQGMGIRSIEHWLLLILSEYNNTSTTTIAFFHGTITLAISPTLSTIVPLASRSTRGHSRPSTGLFFTSVGASLITVSIQQLQVFLTKSHFHSQALVHSRKIRSLSHGPNFRVIDPSSDKNSESFVHFIYNVQVSSEPIIPYLHYAIHSRPSYGFAEFLFIHLVILLVLCTLCSDDVNEEQKHIFKDIRKSHSLHRVRTMSIKNKNATFKDTSVKIRVTFHPSILSLLS
jgi:hypothetical protein